MREPDEPGNHGQVGSRALLAGSVAYGILAAVALAALAAFGTLPAASETGPQLVTWFRENRDSVRWGVWALTVTAPPFALVVALLRRLLPVPHRDMFLVGAVAFTVATSVWSWTWGGLALHADQFEPATARTVLDVAVFYGPVLTGFPRRHHGCALMTWY